MSTSRNVSRGDIPSYYTTATDDDDNDDGLDDEYLARFSTYSTASADLPLPPPPPVPPKTTSIHSTVSYSSGSGSASSIHDEAVPLTATRGRRASAASQILLSRPPTALSLLAPQTPTILATTTDDHSVAPSPSHSFAPPPLVPSGSSLRPDSTSTDNSSRKSQRGSRSRRPVSEQPDYTEQDPNRLSTTSARSARGHLAAALAALPWAEPPPRTVSPSSSSLGGPPYPTPPPINPGFSVPTSVTGSYSSVRSPAYAFLQDDPATSPAVYTHARSSSRASSSSRGREGGMSGPSSGGAESRRSSMGSTHTPMAESMWIAPAQALGERPVSGYSGMADAMSGSTHELSEESLIRSLSAAIRRLSRAPTARSTKSNKSTKSSKSLAKTKSVKSTKSKRASGSTISHRYAGTRWSVDPEGQARLVGGPDEWEEVDVKQREADLDLLTLVGRAAVLERMLRAGKRVSHRGAALGDPAHADRQTSNSTMRQQGRLSVQSVQNRFNPSRTSLRPSHPSRPSASSRLSANSMNGSRVDTPRTSLSLRGRLARRLKRQTSREDTFTEIGDVDGDEDDAVERLATPEKDGGVTVFPERISLPPPPLPEKPRRDGVHCTDVVCISPTSPTPFFDYSQMEKGEPPQQVHSSAWVEQSPHLGHRSPNWRKRQSVKSYISTGNWDQKARKRWVYAVLVGAGVVLILIVGLLSGLLSRRN